VDEESTFTAYPPVPSILVTLGIGLMFDQVGIEPAWYSSGLGARLTWTLPFGLLIMFAVFNRFDPSYEEAARDLGATPWQVLRHIILPIIGPSLVGVGLVGFTMLDRRRAFRTGSARAEEAEPSVRARWALERSDDGQPRTPVHGHPSHPRLQLG
jgi:hypothetical protein